MEIRKIKGESAEMRILEAINVEAIPENERCALSEMEATGAEILCIDVGAEPVGFMAIRRYGNLIYLAYFAVRADLRSEGIGGKALRELIRRNPEKQVVVEYEAPESSGDVRSMKVRRKQFYLRNGFYETGWYTCYDGEEFEIGCSRPDFDSEEFTEFSTGLTKVISDHIPNPFQKESS